MPLNEAVSRRRRELGYTKSELARRAQITRSTIHEIENGTRKHLQAATYLALDEALRWEPGTLEAMTQEKVVAYVSKNLSSDDRAVILLAVELMQQMREEMAEMRRIMYENQPERPAASTNRSAPPRRPARSKDALSA